MSSKIEWIDISKDIKKQVIELLDYESRCNLKLCSKSDYELVNSTKVFKIGTLKIHETLSEFIEGKTIIRCEMDSLTIWLIGKENLTRIDRGWNGEIIEELSEIKHEHRYEIFHRFVDWITHKGVIQAESVEVDGLHAPVPEPLKLNIQNLTLIDVPNSKNWLQKITSPENRMKKLSIALRWDEDIREEISRLKIMETVNFYNISNLGEEDLNGVLAPNLRIYNGRIGEEWIREMLKIHLTYGNRSDEFCITLNLTGVESEVDPFKYIPKNLKVRKDTKEGYTENAFCGNITGGFTNIHGIQDRRQLSIIPYNSKISISCKIYENPKGPYQMHPISDKYD